MAKPYGDRWQIVDGITLGQGGQGQVFRVTDVTGEHAGTFALKRVLNPAREDRFRSEIEAVKRLDHPNVVKLVDHSVLDAGASADKQFLVMPVAEGGDLSRSDRLGLYSGSIEAVLKVAKQIASGLKAAHAAGIIHRDMKPENVLFPGVGHEVWIADFGICLVRGRQRATETGEVVGPHAFMAPELDDGGRLDVSPAADVYSLGKVIYYMISGGVVVPRERLHEERYSRILKSGERLRLLELLLSQMICPLGSRLKDMDTVISRLENIEAWEQNAMLLPMSAAGQADIEKLQRQAQTRRRVTDENVAAREQERLTRANVKETFEAWIGAELKKVASHISSGGDLRCTVGEITLANNHDWLAVHAHNRAYRPIGGLELSLEQAEDPSRRHHTLQIRLCEDPGPLVTVTVHVGGGRPDAVASPVAARDLQLAMIPYYRQTVTNQRQTVSPLAGFLTTKKSIGIIRGQVVLGRRKGFQHNPAVNYAKAEAVSLSFHPDITQCVAFRASDWPTVTDKLRSALSEATDSYISYIASGASVIGP